MLSWKIEDLCYNVICNRHLVIAGETSKCLQINNDDICSVCHYGGDLVLCDKCPSSFHQSCLGLKVHGLF